MRDERQRRVRGTGSKRKRQQIDRNRWMWQLRAPNGYVESFPGTEREAEQRLSALCAAVTDGRLVKNEDLTVGALLDRYLTEHQEGRNLSERHLANQRAWKTNHIIPALGRYKAAKLQPTDVDAFLRKLGYGETAKKCFDLLSGAYRWAIRKGILNTNPMERVDKPSVIYAERRVPDPDELARIIEAADQLYGFEYATLLRLTAVTGVRNGEVAGWKVKDVDTHLGGIWVRRVVDRHTNRVKTYPKSKKRRFIVLDDGTVAMLRAYLDRCAARITEFGIKLTGDAWLFSPRPDHVEHFRSDGVGSRFGRVRDKARVNCSFYGLRHFCGTFLMAKGTDPRTVMERLGHTNIQTTMGYAHGTSEASRKAAATIAGLVSGV